MNDIRIDYDENFNALWKLADIMAVVRETHKKAFADKTERPNVNVSIAKEAYVEIEKHISGIQSVSYGVRTRRRKNIEIYKIYGSTIIFTIEDKA